jgi:prevent-host-death family protein
MTSMGIRELRQNLSHALRRAEGGETIEVTRDGEPIALIVPVPKGSKLERLLAEGRVRPPSGSLEEFLKLPRLRSTTGISASEALQEDRGE